MGTGGGDADRSDALAALLRWEDAGGGWELLGTDGDEAVVGLLTCDGGEQVDTLRSRDADLLSFVRDA